MTKDVDYYEVLGVARNATPEEIKKAWRKLSQKHHPDAGGDAAMQRAINEAYAVLSDESKRARYDQFGDADFDLEEHAKMEVCSLFESLLDADIELEDMPAECVLAIDEKIAEAQSAKRKGEDTLKRYERRGKWMKKAKGGGADLFAVVRETKIADVRRRLRDMDRLIAVERRAREIVLDYEDVRPKKLPGPEGQRRTMADVIAEVERTYRMGGNRGGRTGYKSGFRTPGEY